MWSSCQSWSSGVISGQGSQSLGMGEYRREMAVRFTTWNEVTDLTTAA